MLSTDDGFIKFVFVASTKKVHSSS